MDIKPTPTSLRLPRLALTYRNIDELKPDPKNPRVRSPSLKRRLQRSIKEFGPCFPVATDANDVVVVGNGRLEAMKAQGYTQVPTIRLEHLTPSELRALQIADNRLVEHGEWDDRLLGEAFQELLLEGVEFDLTLTGFDIGEIDIVIEGLSDGQDTDTQLGIVEADVGPAVTRLDDLWLLGDHRLLCANSLEAGSFDRLCQGATADAVFTDQPFNVPIQGHVSGLGKVEHREFVMGSGEMSDSAFQTFLNASCALIAQNLRPGGVAFMCMDWRHIDQLIEAGKASFSDLINICVWVKTAPGMGSLWRSQHELVAVFRKTGAGHRNNVQLGKYGRSRSNVWTYAGMTGFGRHTDEGDLLKIHPTCKSVPMVADAILDVTARGEIVLDPFLGSGTTLIAAERVGRRCYAIELDSIYVDAAVRRWQRLTGEAALHAETGKTFDETAKERES